MITYEQFVKMLDDYHDIVRSIASRSAKGYPSAELVQRRQGLEEDILATVQDLYRQIAREQSVNNVLREVIDTACCGRRE